MSKIRTVVLLMICLGIMATGVHAAPHLLVSEKTIQFREVKPGQKVSKELSLTNTGDEQLEIGKIRTSCSCIEIDWPIKLIAPGKTVPVTVTFNSKGKSAGQGYYQLLIYSSDPKQKIARVPILTDITRNGKGLAITPEVLDFGKVMVSKGIPVMNITVSNSSSTSFHILEVRPGSGVDIPELPADTVAPGDRITIPVTLHAWIREGIFNSSLKIRTSDPSMPSFHCTIRGIIRK